MMEKLDHRELDLKVIFQNVIKDISKLRESFGAVEKAENLNQTVWISDTASEVRSQLTSQFQKLQGEFSAVTYRRAQAIDDALSKHQELLTKGKDIAAKKAILDVEAEGKYVVAGCISDEQTGEGLSNITVEAFDADPDKEDDLLGSAKTDEYGYYRIEYERKDFDKGKTGQEKEPETYIVIRDENGKEIVSTRKPVKKAGKKKIIDITVDGNLFPNSQSLLRKFKELREQKLKQLDQRQQTLKNRFNLSDKIST